MSALKEKKICISAVFDIKNTSAALKAWNL